MKRKQSAKQTYKIDQIKYTEVENCRDEGEMGKKRKQIGLRAMLNEDKWKWKYKGVWRMCEKILIT